MGQNFPVGEMRMGEKPVSLLPPVNVTNLYSNENSNIIHALL